jgi:formiminoglutamase
MNTALEFIPGDYFQLNTSKRHGEIRLGEQMHFGKPTADHHYLILGIEESIGPRANLGNAGAENAFKSFISRFANMQSNSFLKGNEICLLGSIRAVETSENIDSLRTSVLELDTFVQAFIQKNVQAHQKLIVIGGGHNNALPIICAMHHIHQQQLDVVNLDPHADCRAPEGRHSGNSFSIALEEKQLNSYSVLGLHKPYNNQKTLDFLDKNAVFHTFFEDYMLGKASLDNHTKTLATKLTSSPCIGLEIDMDAIAYMPSSAFSPSGFQLEEVRKYLHHMATLSQVSYLHLPEAAPTNPNEEKIASKALAYLVWDFIYSCNQAGHTPEPNR